MCALCVLACLYACMVVYACMLALLAAEIELRAITVLAQTFGERKSKQRCHHNRVAVGFAGEEACLEQRLTRGLAHQMESSVHSGLILRISG